MKQQEIPRTLSLSTALLMFLLVVPATAEIVIETIAPAQWGAPDATLGLGGGLVEDFEDLQLVTGLQIEISDAAGQFTGTGVTTLPNTFDPVSGDPFGDSFAGGAWDGSRVLVNTVDNQSQTYGSADWRPISLIVPAGAEWIAVAGQQVTVNHVLFVNGTALNRLASYGFAVGPDRNGILIVRSTDPSEPIVSVSFGGRGDAFVVDHVVFAEPGSVAVESASWAGLKALFR